MAGKNPIEDFCDETTCSVCLESFKDPVIIDCGHIFCQACISQCCEKLNTEAACPQCREPVQQRNFRPNRQLASIVKIAQKFSLRVAKETEGPERVCERHQEPLKLFCKDDQDPICVVCDKSKEHKTHNVIPKEEAFEEYKGTIQSHLEVLKKNREAILSSQQCGETERKNLLEKTEAQRQKIVAEFEQLHKLLEEREHFLLAQLKDLDDAVNEHLDNSLEELSSLDNLIKEMEEKQNQLADEFLQDIGSFLQRCNQKTFVKPVFPPELKKQIELLSEAYSFPDVKKSIANMTGNLRSVPTLKLSKNPGISQNFGAFHGSFTISRPGANQVHYMSSVLGVENITSGTHSWTVDVGCEPFWAIGVAKDSLCGSDNWSLRPDLGIWAVGKSLDNQCYALKSGMPLWQCYNFSMPMLNCPWASLNCRMPRRIKVILNYEEGSVTFVNSDNNGTIFTFNAVSFSGEKICSWCATGLLA